jgi:two-component system, OmpR family, phosphate regulon sensor histidine kinase PhoR
VTFRTRLFVMSSVVTAITLALATAIVSWNLRGTFTSRTERVLIDEARLAAETLTHRRAATPAELDGEADAIGQLLSRRITFISADGHVVGDSEIAVADLPKIENHGARPEIVQARREGLGIARRYSATINVDLLYVAVPVNNPAAPDLAVVRLALPLTGIEHDLAAVRRGALAAFAVGLAVALGLAWLASALLANRVRSMAEIAQRYATGDVTRRMRDYGDDELGNVAEVLDSSFLELGRRVAELHSDRARMAAILGGMIEGVVVVNNAGRLQLVNDAAARMLRLEDDWEGRHYLEVVRHPDVAAQITAALHGLMVAASEVTLPRDPGVTLMARAAPVASDAVRGAVLVLHDISDLRRSDQIRRDFVANVSHELRTPLTSVRGYVEALMDEHEGGAKTRQFLDTIARHTARMERLVHDLLRLARLDAKQELLERVSVDVETLVAGVRTELAADLDAKQQTVDVRVGDGAEAVEADPAKLHDVLRNLVENASRHGPHGSSIEVASERSPESVRITVADRGPGMPEADLPRVFERFYRVDKGRTRDSRDRGGTGLGLSIVKHLVELHGGSVKADNRAGGGAVFTIDLPVE